jgi:hypothetical protein
MTTPLMENTLQALSEEDDLELARQAAAGNLVLLDGAARSDPENPRLLLLACRGYASYALAFVGEDEVPRARALFERAMVYGQRVFRAQRRLSALPDARAEDLPRLLAHCRRDDVSALFWSAFAWGTWINLSRDNPEALVHLPRVEALMRRVLELDETYFYGGPHLFFGTLYGSRPAALGGDPARAKEHFERNLRISQGRFLLTYYYYARYLAVETQDRDLFDALLRKIADAPANPLPEQRLVNAVARARAKRLLAEADDLF